MLPVNREAIKHGLGNLGVASGAVLLVHGSLRSIGYVEGGAMTVIEALLESVGREGTVLVPTLTGNENLSQDNPPFFDPVTSRSLTGIIPETFMHRPEAVRSLHPTHSVAAIGPLTDDLTQDHLNSITPCDIVSPYGKLAELDNGYILLLGVDHATSTMMHHVEEIVGVDYHMQPGVVNATVVVKGVSRNIHLMIHKYGAPRDFNVVDLMLSERGIQVTGKVGNATARLVQAKAMVAVVRRCLMADRRFLLKKS